MCYIVCMNAIENKCWANEVGTSFFAEKCDLDTCGWTDPWGRPLNKIGFTYLTQAGGWSIETKNVQSPDNVSIELALYTAIVPTPA